MNNPARSIIDYGAAGGKAFPAIVTSAETDINLYTSQGSFLTPAAGLTNLPAGWSATGRKIVVVYSNLALGSFQQMIFDVEGVTPKRYAIRGYSSGAFENWSDLALVLESNTFKAPQLVDQTPDQIYAAGGLAVMTVDFIRNIQNYGWIAGVATINIALPSQLSFMPTGVLLANSTANLTGTPLSGAKHTIYIDGGAAAYTVTFAKTGYLFDVTGQAKSNDTFVVTVPINTMKRIDIMYGAAASNKFFVTVV